MYIIAHITSSNIINIYIYIYMMNHITITGHIHGSSIHFHTLLLFLTDSSMVACDTQDVALKPPFPPLPLKLALEVSCGQPLKVYLATPKRSMGFKENTG